MFKLYIYYLITSLKWPYAYLNNISINFYTVKEYIYNIFG